MNGLLFNILSRDLQVHRSRLLEASAGTGKTYSIENLVVRFLLEEDGIGSIGIEEILIVSFTKATAEELKIRVRENIVRSVLYLKGRIDASPPDYLQALIERGSEAVGQALYRLQQALVGYDKAQIYTIHAFCKSMLAEMEYQKGAAVVSAGEQLSQSEIRRAVFDCLRLDVKEPRYSAGQLGVVLKLFEGDLSSLVRKLCDLSEKGALIAPGTPLAESFCCFKKEMERLASSYSSDGILEDFYALAVNYKELASKGGEIKPEIRFQAERFTMMFDQEEWSIDDLDWLIVNGIPFFDYFVPEKEKSVRKQVYPICPGLIPAMEGLREIVECARDPLTVLSTLANDCQQRVGEILIRDEKFRYDDLLLRMWKALANPDFTAAMRKRYRAAVIDEFQDTDPLQWDIFKTLFLGNAYLYLVGDPKQSIYGFRQADIYTYLDAARLMGEENKATLSVNYRSQPALVHSLNELFAKDHLAGLLLLPKQNTKIPYSPVQPPPKAEEKTFSDGKGSVHFFLMEDTLGRGKNLPSERGEEEYIFSYIIKEILERKMQDGVRYADWALLVKDRFQAQRFIRLARRFRIPIVSQWQNRLVDSPAFEAMRCLLEAGLRPDDSSLMKRLLVQPMCGWTLEALLELEDEECAGYKTLLSDLSHTLYEKGFAPFYASFVDAVWKKGEECAVDILLRQEEGIEFYQELQQLAEYLIEYESGNHARPETLLLHLRELADLDEDENKLYVKEDLSKDAVRVLTMHMSKGLEFPYVAVPGVVKRGGKKQRNQINYSASFEKGDPVLRIVLPEAGSIYHREDDAEKMRQLYVAWTRAKYRLYIPAAVQTDLKRPLQPGEPSPIELYLAMSIFPDEEPCRAVSRLNLENVSGFLDRRGQNAAVTYEVLASPVIPPVYREDTASKEHLQKPPEIKIQGKPLYVHSFSSLSSPHEFDSADLPPPHDYQAIVKNCSTLPSGSDTGILVHKILETVSFDAPLPSIRETVEHLTAGTKLKDWPEVISEAVSAILNQPIETSAGQFSLSQVSSAKMYREIEFLYPYSVDKTTVPKALAEFSLYPQYLRGVIDLVLEYNERYYLIDWKTNWLGPDKSCYSHEALAQAMSSNDYLLQASIYREALRRYIQVWDRRPFEQSFGGILYFFVRGADPNRPNAGIYFLS